VRHLGHLLNQLGAAKKSKRGNAGGSRKQNESITADLFEGKPLTGSWETLTSTRLAAE